MLSRGLTVFIFLSTLICRDMQMTVYFRWYKLYSLLLYFENPWRYLQEGTKSLCFEVSSSHSVCHLNTNQLTIHSSAFFVLDECHYQLALLGVETVAIQLLLGRTSCLVWRKLWWWHWRDQWNRPENCVIIQLSKGECSWVSGELKNRPTNNHLSCGWHRPGLVPFLFL